MASACLLLVLAAVVSATPRPEWCEDWVYMDNEQVLLWARATKGVWVFDFWWCGQLLSASGGLVESRFCEWVHCSLRRHFSWGSQVRRRKLDSKWNIDSKAFPLQRNRKKVIKEWRSLQEATSDRGDSNEVTVECFKLKNHSFSKAVTLRSYRTQQGPLTLFISSNYPSSWSSLW